MLQVLRNSVRIQAQKSADISYSFTLLNYIQTKPTYSELVIEKQK